MIKENVYLLFKSYQRFLRVTTGRHQANIRVALEQIPYTQIRDSINDQLDKGKAPIEAITPEVVRMPLYGLINDPLGTVWEGKNVKKNVKMADFSVAECIAV